MSSVTRSDDVGVAPSSALSRPVPANAGISVLRRRRLGHRLLRHQWDRKASSWDSDASPLLGRVVSAVLAAADARPGMTAVDLGCGTGSLALELARMGVQVIAVDISPVMIARLREKAARAGLDCISCVVGAVQGFDLPEASVDLVVSNYALHHLRNNEKEVLVRSVARWLRPGGRFVVGDMMFGRGRTARDWGIIGSKAALLARRGPGGLWRVAKNLVRFGLRIGEHPAELPTWERYLREAGFVDVSARALIAEAGVAVATKPKPTDPGRRQGLPARPGR
ncbi:MAG: class I SAM-dependent methyltransferase [Acidimicrobiales bacterium]